MMEVVAHFLNFLIRDFVFSKEEVVTCRMEWNVFVMVMILRMAKVMNGHDFSDGVGDVDSDSNGCVGGDSNDGGDDDGDGGFGGNVDDDGDDDDDCDGDGDGDGGDVDDDGSGDGDDVGDGDGDGDGGDESGVAREDTSMWRNALRCAQSRFYLFQEDFWDFLGFLGRRKSSRSQVAFEISLNHEASSFHIRFSALSFKPFALKMFLNSE